MKNFRDFPVVESDPLISGSDFFSFPLSYYTITTTPGDLLKHLLV